MWLNLVYQEYNFGIVINKIYVPFQMWQILFYKKISEFPEANSPARYVCNLFISVLIIE